jgi:hypothetical protein
MDSQGYSKLRIIINLNLKCMRSLVYVCVCIYRLTNLSYSQGKQWWYGMENLPAVVIKVLEMTFSVYLPDKSDQVEP